MFERAWVQVLQSTKMNKIEGRKTMWLHLIGKNEEYNDTKETESIEGVNLDFPGDRGRIKI